MLTPIFGPTVVDLPFALRRTALRRAKSRKFGSKKSVSKLNKTSITQKESSRATIRRPPHDVADAPPPPPLRLLGRPILARAPPVLRRGPARFLELAPQGIEVVGVVGLGRERDVDADVRRIVVLDCGLHNQSRPPDDEAAAVVARDEAIHR